MIHQSKKPSISPVPESDPQEPSWDMKRLLLWATNYLKNRGFETARLDVELLLAFVLKLPRIQIYIQYDRPLAAQELAEFKNLLLRRVKHEPIAYITGEKDFMNLSFQVNPDVLIPRPETELLVEHIINYAQSLNESSVHILDVGTGSGCIAISLAHALKEACIHAWDISEKALFIAHANALRHHPLPSELVFTQKDALLEKNWQEEKKFHIIVSNPPYISTLEEKDLTPASGIFHEPRSALFAEDDGLIFYKWMAQQAKQRLFTGGKIVFEIGSSQGAKVSAILASQSWQNIRVFKDYSGHDRIVEASL